MPNEVIKLMCANTSPAERYRQQCAESLREHMDAVDMTRKQLQSKLAEQNTPVTRQAIESWLKGHTAPRPHHQAAIARILGVPAHRIFPIEVA
jgi:hypothetical protein